VSTILCIDEEPAAGAVLEHTVAELGCRPLLVGSIADGIRALARQPVDLIISECRTSGQVADELLQHLREGQVAVPVIVTTAFGSIDHAVRMMRLGAADYLTKPLRAEGVRLAVRGALEIERLRRELRTDAGPSREEAIFNIRVLEQRAIERALAATGGRRARAAALLGISERTLRNKLNKPPGRPV
jgi:DNA-binding NtrC family response regulator